MTSPPRTVRSVSAELFARYQQMLDPNSHLHWLCSTALEHQHTLPIDKLSRWLGFVQGVLHNQGITSSEVERDFSRPLFHEAYRNEGIEIPPTRNPGSGKD